MPIKLYGVLRSRATRNVWLMNEIGIPFELVPVIQAYRLPDPSSPAAPLNTASPAFRAINPAGHIPVINDDGLVLAESLAINLYLARKHKSAFSPQDGREDALMTMWTLWAACDCEPHTIQILMQQPGAPAGSQDPKALDKAIAALERPLHALEEVLREGGGYLVGRRFTVADINAVEVMRYAQPAPELFAGRPAVKAWIEACQARPVFREMMDERRKEPA
jgi:glutathione S-transferase